MNLDICLQQVFDLTGTSRGLGLVVARQGAAHVFELPQPFGLLGIHR